MITADLMCLSYTRLRECGGYRAGLCSGCSQRDVIYIHICDKCRIELEPEEIHPVNGMELCEDCLKKGG